MNATFGELVHCVAAEPHGVLLRVGVYDGTQEVAYEIAVLGRLRGGFRVLQLRSMLGTRIELCHLFVHVEHGTEANVRMTARQVQAAARAFAV